MLKCQVLSLERSFPGPWAYSHETVPGHSLTFANLISPLVHPTRSDDIRSQSSPETWWCWHRMLHFYKCELNKPLSCLKIPSLCWSSCSTYWTHTRDSVQSLQMQPCVLCFTSKKWFNMEFSAIKMSCWFNNQKQKCVYSKADSLLIVHAEGAES